MYSNTRLNSNVEREVEAIIGEGEYACGGNLIDDESHLRHVAVVRRMLTCESGIETQYYSSKLQLPPVCSHCGGISGAKLVDLTEMLKKFAQVRPICTYCEKAGLKPITRAPRMDHPDAKKKRK